MKLKSNQITKYDRKKNEFASPIFLSALWLIKYLQNNISNW